MDPVGLEFGELPWATVKGEVLRLLVVITLVGDGLWANGEIGFLGEPILLMRFMNESVLIAVSDFLCCNVCPGDPPDGGLCGRECDEWSLGFLNIVRDRFFSAPVFCFNFLSFLTILWPIEELSFLRPACIEVLSNGIALIASTSLLRLFNISCTTCT